MSVKIRLKRVGKKKQPTYRIVVADSRRAAKGKFIENIGQYDPSAEPNAVTLDQDRTMSWLKNGAQCSQQVEKILDQVGLWEQFMATKAEAKRRGPLRTGSQTEKKVVSKEAPKSEALAPQEAPAADSEPGADSAPEETRVPPEDTPPPEAANEESGE